MKLYGKGSSYSTSLPQKIKAEQLEAQEKEAGRNAKELIEMEERAQRK